MVTTLENQEKLPQVQARFPVVQPKILTYYKLFPLPSLFLNCQSCPLELTHSPLLQELSPSVSLLQRRWGQYVCEKIMHNYAVQL
jgi:hypothetical protein